MTWKTKLITGAAAIAFAWPGLAAADEATDARIKALEEQLELLQSQIADLKQSTANNIADVRKEATATTVSLANGRPTIATADGNFTASFRGVFQLDAAHYDQAAAGPLATDFRRGSYGDANENDHARDLSGPQRHHHEIARPAAALGRQIVEAAAQRLGGEHGHRGAGGEAVRVGHAPM